MIENQRPTPEQQTARSRNFKIFRLRGLWTQCGMLTGGRCTMARSAIDAELISLGAEPETARRKNTAA